MFYRIMIVANFPTLPPATYLNTIKGYIEANAITVNPGLPHTEISAYSLHKCYHDEDSTKPCDLIAEYQTPA